MKHKWILIPAFILVAVAIFMFLPKKNKELPENLMGRWTTSEPKYIDRYFELTKTTFTYGLGENKENVYIISSIEKSMEGNKTLYTISYKDPAGLVLTRSFYFESVDGGVIKFKNQKKIEWTKEEDGTVEENLKTDQNKKAG